MYTFFSRIIKTVMRDTGRAYAGTAVSIALGSAGEFAYNKMKQPILKSTSNPLASEIIKDDEDAERKNRPDRNDYTREIKP